MKINLPGNKIKKSVFVRLSICTLACLATGGAPLQAYDPYYSLWGQSRVDAVGDQKQTSECTSWAVASAVAMNVMRNWYTVNSDSAPEIETLSDRGYRMLDASTFHLHGGKLREEGWHIQTALQTATQVTIPFMHDRRFGVRISPDGYKSVSGNNAARQEIFLNRPVIADFEIMNDFRKSKAYIYTGQGATSMSPREFHSILIVGYNTNDQTRRNASGGEFWECLNSWSPNFGTGGFFRIRPNVCGLGDRQFVVNNTYICDSAGNRLPQEAQNQVISDAINAIPSVTNAVHKNVLFHQLNGQKLPDGDQVRVSASAGNAGKDKVTINLILPKGMWWKGALLFDKATASNPVGVQGEGGGSGFSQSFTFKRTELLRKDLVLSKAKTFGVHTNMYRIKDAFTNMQPGKTYTFSWVKD
ncbi:MAG: C1 family peptidase [Verrucomicrobiales bacterium]|nr:C1 family peptidase [Verrucomicrobiales bacterium]